jgi:hypothetical protein
MIKGKMRMQQVFKVCTGINMWNYADLKNLNNWKAICLIDLKFWGVADIYTDNYYSHC